MTPTRPVHHLSLSLSLYTGPITPMLALTVAHTVALTLTLTFALIRILTLTLIRPSPSRCC